MYGVFSFSACLSKISPRPHVREPSAALSKNVFSVIWSWCTWRWLNLVNLHSVTVVLHCCSRFTSSLIFHILEIIALLLMVWGFFCFFLFFFFNYLYFPTKLPGITQLLSVFPPGWIDFDFLCSHSRILNYHLQFCAQRNRMLSDNPGTQRADFSPIYFLSLVTFRLNWSLGAALKMNRVSARFSKHYLWETCIDCWASSVTNDDSLGAKHYLPILNAMWL